MQGEDLFWNKRNFFKTALSGSDLHNEEKYFYLKNEAPP